MPVVYLKSGGQAVCGGCSYKDGVVKLVDVTFRDAGLPPDKVKQPEAVVSLANVLYVLPGQ